MTEATVTLPGHSEDGDWHVSARALASGVMLVAGVVLYLVERAAPGPWVSWAQGFGVLATLIYLWIFLRNQQAVVLTSFFQIYSTLGMMLSAVIISTGTLMIEIGRVGTANGIFWVLMIYLVVGMEATRVGYYVAARFRWGHGMLRPSETANRALIFLFVGVTLSIAAYVLVVAGGPVLRGVDRVTFWRQMAPPGSAVLPSLVSQTFFFMAFHYLFTRRTAGRMIVPNLILLGYLVTAVLVLGEKMTMFIVFLNVWFLVLPGVMGTVILRTGHLWLLLGALTILIGFTAINYLAEDREAGFVLVRAALQSQLLWSVFDEPGALSLWPSRADCLVGCWPFSSGREYITFRYLPVGLFYHYDKSGNALSGFMPALVILTLGMVLAMALHIVMSFLLGILQQKLIMALTRRNLVDGFLLFKLQFGVAMTWYASTAAPIKGIMVTLLLILILRATFPVRPAAPRPG
ncbi:hypothetical protein ACEYYB_06645 [Paracoccus sp. p4-l81]|uniref:hypothetical protein n=1 Tax=Paracoccus sp. p4-l81 TaxID=3342806 RepID=UPI0035B6CBA5